jgi:hypothetical protein
MSPVLAAAAKNTKSAAAQNRLLTPWDANWPGPDRVFPLAETPYLIVSARNIHRLNLPDRGESRRSGNWRGYCSYCTPPKHFSQIVRISLDSRKSMRILFAR